MKIKQIKLENNIYFGNITFDFTNETGEIMDNIILAGENGCGKTQLLNILYEFSELSTSGIVNTEKRIFTILLSNEEITKINNINTLLCPPTGEFEITQDFTTQPNYWNRIKIRYKYIEDNGNTSFKNIDSSTLFSNANIKNYSNQFFQQLKLIIIRKPHQL